MGGMTMVREEPEIIRYQDYRELFDVVSVRKWKVEQEEMLRLKDQDEEIKKEELRQKAAQELAEW